MNNFRPLDPKEDWEFFDPDFAVPDHLLAYIHPFAEESANALWHEHISQIANHPMKLSDWAWPARLFRSLVRADWQTDWNDDTATVFTDWLRTTLPWTRDTPVIFSQSATCSTQTNWETFLRCWRSFLVADEGSFLWSLQHPEAIGFSPMGFACVGHRLHKAADDIHGALDLP